MNAFYRILSSSSKTALLIKIIGITSLFFSGITSYSATYATLPAQQIDSIISVNFANPDFYIIDVRTPSEFASGHIPNAYNIDYRGSSFSDIIDTLDRSVTYVVHCQSGGRSAGAMQMIKDKAFDTAYEMQGGMNKWTYTKTTSDLRQIFRMAAPELAHQLILSGDISVYDCTSAAAFDQFNIAGSRLLPSGFAACQDSLAAADKSAPVLLYSSDSTALDSLFFHLFQTGFAEVYYLTDLQGWIDSGYAYNTLAPKLPDANEEPELPTETSLLSSSFEAYFTAEGLYIQSDGGQTVSVYSISGELLVRTTGSGTIPLSNQQHAVIVTTGNMYSTLTR